MNLVSRVTNIILNPTMEWEVIKTETITIKEMYTRYVMVLVTLPSVAGLIGFSFVGRSVMGQTYRRPLSASIVWAVIGYVLTVVCIYLLGVVIDKFAPSFGCAKDMNTSQKVAVFGTTASLLAGIFMIIPGMSILGLAGFYSLFLLYTGMRSLKHVPPERLAGYYVLTLIVSIVINFAIVIFVAAPLAFLVKP
jgi:uncharacterized membrane protein YidH (DUF202 family)